MSENDKPVDYGSIIPDFTEKEVVDSARFKKALQGIYLWRVTSATQAISKPDKPTAKGWYMAAEEWTALRVSDRAPSMLSVRTWTLLPLRPNPLGLMDVGYSGEPVAVAPDGAQFPVTIMRTEGAPASFNAEGAPEGSRIMWTGRIGEILATFDPDGGPKKLTLNKFKDRMRAWNRDCIPPLPQKNTASKEALDKARVDQTRIIKTLAVEVFKDPSILVGTEHYAELYYEKEQTINEVTGAYEDVIVATEEGVEEVKLKEWPSVRYPRNVADPPKFAKDKGGALKPILDPFVSYK